jgi:hypothetical protein
VVVVFALLCFVCGVFDHGWRGSKTESVMGVVESGHAAGGTKLFFSSQQHHRHYSFFWEKSSENAKGFHGSPGQNQHMYTLCVDF